VKHSLEADLDAKRNRLNAWGRMEKDLKKGGKGWEQKDFGQRGETEGQGGKR